MSDVSSAGPRLKGADLRELERELSKLVSEMLDCERTAAARWKALPADRRDSARNLLHYLALRRHDLRPMQDALAAEGLSSLGRAEAHVMENVAMVQRVVRRLLGLQVSQIRRNGASGHLLESNTVALLGPRPAGRDVRIMVTIPGEAAEEPGLIRDLLVSGMDCMRINAAHDYPAAWDQMLRHLEAAREETGRSCRVLMDVAGPKIRTGRIEPALPVLRWRPARDRYGRVAEPAYVWLTSSANPHPAPEDASAVVPVSAEWIAGLRSGDVIKLFDARGSMRALRVQATPEGGAWCTSDQTAYVVPGTTLHLTRGRSRGTTVVADLPPSGQTIRLAPGDTLVLRAGETPGHPARLGNRGVILQPAAIGVTLPQIFDDVRSGEPIWFDDGAIGGVIQSVTPEAIHVNITKTRPGGGKLGADKGINLPETALRLPALTEKDRDDLRFIDGRADLVGYSFVRTDTDVFDLQAHLESIGSRHLGIVLKIETRKGFEELPSLLLAAMRSPSSGVMIARGDLAVECGYERLAEVQEEILWMAEASHTPVIWATQVLESLAKGGVPSRAEITDAAMAERAECVMLNKGPYVVDAVRMLDDILTRMEAHQHKKSAKLRDLRVAEHFFAA